MPLDVASESVKDDLPLLALSFVRLRRIGVEHLMNHGTFALRYKVQSHHAAIAVSKFNQTVDFYLRISRREVESPATIIGLDAQLQLPSHG